MTNKSGIQQRSRVRPSPLHPGIWHIKPLFFLLFVSPLLFKNSAEKEKTIFQIIQAVISRLPTLSAIDSGRGPSPTLSILLHTQNTPAAQ
ncbi:hypothetical protein Q8A67_015299 [Cirrhinus molitorella]|uniref:Uncharacterized protein n=1 Tax=Cirrhinus molitorella TaxID=172907 RepID=A0AA88PNK7_9TELE|nr:hypothetical protein Q8A67_015299 [Cirrhinus molitorella]